jgi:hypothetical protein
MTDIMATEFALDEILERRGAFVDALLRLALAPAAVKSRLQEILDAAREARRGAAGCRASFREGAVVLSHALLALT